MTCVAIIPARGGSKSIPKKNLIDLGGKPLIAYSIESALNSRCIDRVIVSTDCPEIAAISSQIGAEVPFLRPPELGLDHVLDLPVFRHAVDFLNLSSEDIVVHLRPTSPLRKQNWIKHAILDLRNDSEASSLRSVHLVREHPYRAFELDECKRYLVPYEKKVHKPYELRRQDWPSVFYYNCVLDVTKVSTILGGSMVGEKILPFELPEDLVFDLDTIQDLQDIIQNWERFYDGK